MVSRIGCFITFLLLLFSNVQISNAQVFDKIVAVVNDEVITLSDLRIAGGDILNSLGSLSAEERVNREIEAKSTILDKLIENLLIIQEAKNFGISATEEEIQKAVEEVRRKNRLNEKEFSRALSEIGLTIKAYTDNIEKEIIRSKFMSRVIGSRVNISDDEIEFYYNRKGDAFLLPVEVRLGQILILTSENASEDGKKEIRSKAQWILNKIKEGEDFDELASKYSQAPGESSDLGYVKKGEINSEIEKVVFNLKEGEVSGLVETSLGFHIFKIVDIKGENKKPLPEVKEEIESILFNERMEEVYKEWLENMKATSYIEVRL